MRDFTLDLVGQIYPLYGQALSFADTDHDGRNEAIMYIQDSSWSFHYRILEEQGGNNYTDEYSGPELIPFGARDMDGDGKTDLVGQYGDRIQIFESVSASAYPTELVWTSPVLMNVFSYIALADTDQDGRQEIIYSYNPFSGMAKLYIFENTADNTYQQVFVANVGMNDNTGNKVIADLDNDGKIEIAMCGLLGQVYVYEAFGNNLWALAWTYSTGLYNCYGCSGGIDTNGNGKPEFFVSGSGDTSWTSQVFEANGNNQFTKVATLENYDGYLGSLGNAVGDLDGIPPAEFMMEGSGHFWIYRSPGGGAGWTQIAQINDPLGVGHVGLQAYDANRNGRAEVFWEAENPIQFADRTLILEHAVDPTGVEPFLRPFALTAAPNPCRLEARVRVPAGSASVAIVDATGRILGRVPADSAPTGAPVLLRTDGVGAGSYWLRAEGRSGEVLGAGRIVVTR